MVADKRGDKLALEHLKKKLNEVQSSPFTRKTIITRPDGKAEVVTQHISYEEWLADMEDELDKVG